jgi:hypothetical protein
MHHLTGVGTLHMSAMDMDIRSVSVNGNQAHSEVQFRPKIGAPRGTGRQVAYSLDKCDRAWIVLKAQPVSGIIQHLDPSQNPQQNQNVQASTKKLR